VNRSQRVDVKGGNPTIISSAGPGGTISPLGTESFAEGQSRSYSITPYDHYRVQDVVVDGQSVGAVSSYTFSNITAGHTITATFAAETFQLGVSVINPTGGVVTSSPAAINCGTACSASFAFNTAVTLTAAPTACASFGSWGGACSGSGSCTVTMDAAKSVTTTFNVQSITVTASAGSGGTITPAGTVIQNCGGSPAYAITPNAGYHIADVQVDGVSVGALASYTFTNITASHTISAQFASDTQLNVAFNVAGGTVTSTPAGINCTSTCSAGFPANTAVALTASPSAAYNFTNWSGDCSGSTCSINMGATGTVRNVTANFTPNTSGPVRISGTTPRYFSTLQAAYSAAVAGEIIQCQSGTITENPVFNRNIAVTIDGGYSTDYSRTTGSTTALKGMVQTLSGGGILTLKNFILNK
jgi:hypothetical protein